MGVDALSAALSGLRVSQKGLDVVATNVSNASTEGYTRKILPQETVVAGNQGMGVRYGEIQRTIDSAIQRDYRLQLGANSYYSTRQTYLERIVAFHGASEQENNLGAFIGGLYQELVTLSGIPDSRIQQQSVVEQAERVANTFNNFSQVLLDLRNETQTNINSEVNALNANLHDIAEMNKRIQSLANIGRSTATLEDQRDELVKKVAGTIDITYYTDGNGALVLQTKRGQVLVDTEARPITFKNEQLTFRLTYPETVSGVIISDGTAGSYDLASFNPGGKLGALLSLRDEELPSYIAQLDELAHKMAMRFDAQNVRLFTDNTGTVPIDDPAVYTGFASQIMVNPLVVRDPTLLQRGTSGPPLNAGSNEVVMRLVNYTFGKVQDALGTPVTPFKFNNVGYERSTEYNILGDPTATLEEFARTMLNRQAEDLSLSKETAATERQYTEDLQKRLLDTSAVDTDQELAIMIELQKSYSAAAKMIGALDELFRDLMNAVR